MPKILIDANPVVPYLAFGSNSGIGRTCMELIAQLAKMKDSLPFDIELFTQNIKGVKADRLTSAFPSRHLYFRSLPKWNKVAKSLRLRELISRYDLQHITHNYELVTDPSRCIVTVHDAMFFSYPEENFNATQNREIVPPFVRKAKAVITISENSKREIMKYMDVQEDKITVIPWGVDHDLLYPHKVESNRWCGANPYFVSVSCDTGRKNTITLLRAYAKFAKQNPQHHLILVWRNPSDEALKLVADNHLENRVHFASNLSNEELADVYSGATASFFPSLYEGFGLPIAESMACGVPCVTCRNSSLEEVGGEAALYTEAMDSDAMADEMEKFENGSYDMVSLREASIAQASKFTWERCAASTVDLYKKSLGIFSGERRAESGEEERCNTSSL